MGQLITDSPLPILPLSLAPVPIQAPALTLEHRCLHLCSASCSACLDCRLCVCMCQVSTVMCGWVPTCVGRDCFGHVRVTIIQPLRAQSE